MCVMMSKKTKQILNKPHFCYNRITCARSIIELTQFFSWSFRYKWLAFFCLHLKWKKLISAIESSCFSASLWKMSNEKRYWSKDKVYKNVVMKAVVRFLESFRRYRSFLSDFKLCFRKLYPYKVLQWNYFIAV